MTRRGRVVVLLIVGSLVLAGVTVPVAASAQPVHVDSTEAGAVGGQSVGGQSVGQQSDPPHASPASSTAGNATQEDDGGGTGSESGSGDAPGGEFDVAEAPGAELFDREVETYTLAGNFVPREGLDRSVFEVDRGRVHVLAQFTFDDPRVKRDERERDRDLVAEYDLVHCGSYMDGDSGWENAHCFGIPTERVEAFAKEPVVRSVTHVGPELKMYPELEEAIAGTDGGAILLVDTYPDTEVSAGALSERFGVRFTREDDHSFSTARVRSFEVASRIAASPDVAWVTWYRPVYATVADSREHVGVGDLSGPGTGTPGPTGDGVWIGVMDSGIDHTHDHFDGVSIEFSADWVDWGGTPEDQNGHGTHVAGTITGNSTFGGTPLPGVAPDADLVVARVFKQDAWALIAGRILPNGRFKRLASDAPGTMAAVSNSWGMDDTSRVTPISRYDKFARSADKWAYKNPETLLVFANGNACESDPTVKEDRIGCARHVTAPALGKNVLSVGATFDSDLTLDGYDYTAGEVAALNDLNPPEDVVDLNNGRVKPDVLAPGVQIQAPDHTGSYDTKSGTSMATPHVSGVVAVLAEEHPGWDANTIRAVLVATTSPVRNPYGFLEGYGEVNARDALWENDYESTQEVFHGTATEGDVDVVARVTVPEDAYQLDASLAWLDPNKVGGGVTGFVFNRLDLELVSPSGERHRKTNPANVKKIRVSDPEAGEWRVVVTGANVGPAFEPFKALRSQEHEQAYDGVVRVVRDPPRVALEVDGGTLAGPTRIAALEDNDARLDPGKKTNLTVSALGLGYVVSDVEVTVDASGLSGVSTCSGGDTRTLDGGDLSKGQSESIVVCLEADSSATFGVRNVTVELDSTNGVDSGVAAGTRTVTLPVFVTESSPPDPIADLRSTTHTVGDWTRDTTFGFAWDRPNDPGGSGVDGYSHALRVVDSSAAATATIGSPTSGRLWAGDPRSTGVVVVKEPLRECYDPKVGAETCIQRSARLDVNATSTGPSTRQELWFYVRARDNSSNVGPVARLGPFPVDLERPGPFALDAAVPGPDAGTAAGTYYEDTGTYFAYELDERSVALVWRRPTDTLSGVSHYTYRVGDRSGVYQRGRVTDAAAAVAPGDPTNRNRTVTLTGLERGAGFVAVTAHDRAGNRREALVWVCVRGDDPGVECLTPGDIERIREEGEEAIETQELLEELHGGLVGGPLGLDGPGIDPDDPRCPGTYLCGGPHPWGPLVTDDRILLHVQGAEGTVLGRYLVVVEGGRVTSVEPVEAGRAVDRSIDVYGRPSVVREVAAAEDVGGAVARAHGEGRLRVAGHGAPQTLRIEAMKVGAEVVEATQAVVDLLLAGEPGATDGDR